MIGLKLLVCINKKQLFKFGVSYFLSFYIYNLF